MSAGFSATPAELSLVNEIFKKYDTAKLGVITGEVAVRAFQGAKVQPSVLGEIWSVADEENNGWLSKKGVAIALRLIGYAQKGDKITVELVSKREFSVIDSAVLAHPSHSRSCPYNRGNFIRFHK